MTNECSSSSLFYEELLCCCLLACCPSIFIATQDDDDDNDEDDDNCGWVMMKTTMAAAANDADLFMTEKAFAFNLILILSPLVAEQKAKYSNADSFFLRLLPSLFMSILFAVGLLLLINSHCEMNAPRH